MRSFIIRRFLFALLSIIGATVFIFSLTRMAHDPRTLFVPEQGYGDTNRVLWEKLGREWGFDKPAIVQYFTWLGRVIRGDLGRSLFSPREVRTLLGGKLGATLQLAFGAWIFAVGVGLPVGVLAAVKRGTTWDLTARTFALFGLAMPAFWTGIMFILVFAVYLNWLPPGGRGEGLNIKNYILPCVALGWPSAAGLMRLTRSSMLEVLDSEFVKLARAKGVAGSSVIWKHAFRNSMLAPFTAMVFLLAAFLNGAIVIETVFAWPGVGWMASQQAVLQNDFPLMQGAVLIFVSIYVVFAFTADIVYAYLDPRIRYQ
jgi:peptide/nickel transport system permease protein